MQMMASGTSTLTLERYTPEARAWVAAAQQLADERGHVEVQPLHLLVRGLEPELGVAPVFQKAGVEPRELQLALEQALRRLPIGEGTAFLSSAFLGLLRRAEREAERTGNRRVQVEDLLSALTLSVRGDTAEVLASFKIGPGGLKGYMDALRPVQASDATAPRLDKPSEWLRDWIAEARTGDADPVIGRVDEIRRVLTILERRHKCHPVILGEPGVGKGAILRGVAQRIADGDVATSLAAVGLVEIDLGALAAGARLRGEAEARLRKLLEEPLQGRNAEVIFIVRGLGALAGGGPLAPNLAEVFRTRLVSGGLRLLLTGTPDQYRRLQSADPALAQHLTVLRVEPPTVAQSLDVVRGIAFRLEQHHRVQITEGALDAAVRFAQRYLSDRFLPESALDLLDEAAAARRVATDGLSPEFDKERSELLSLRAQRSSLAGVEDLRSQAMLRALDGRIATLQPLVEERRKALEARRGTVGTVRQLRRELETALAAQQVAKAKQDFARLGELEHAVLPALQASIAEAERAAQIAGADMARVHLEESHVAATLAEWTGIPLSRMLEAETQKLVNMQARLAERVVGQDEAVNAITRAVRRGRVGLRDPKKPIGSFLFLGTSGVGKTELAKALAEFLFDDEAALTRLDMSEFMERHMAARLVGSPPGYADSEQGGFLTEAVRQRPYSVLLFDEVEKAHQDVFNLLLQVLDDGRLTDGRGQTADFTNVVIVLTSNIGSDAILEAGAGGFADEAGRQALENVLGERLRGFFRPEFLNRIGDTVVFRPLGKPELRLIADIQLGRVQKLLAPREVTLVVDASAREQLVELGFEPALGARPLQRVITRHLQDPLAEELVRGAYPPGSVVCVGFDGSAFTFGASPPAAPPQSGALEVSEQAPGLQL
jgi:ATP-dependent Clp protease ATP-binding subunit ClpB